MREGRRWGRRAALTCLGVAAWLHVGAVAHAQDAALSAVVDALVKTACGKTVVLLGELPSHGEARAFEIKSRVVDRLVGQCGVTAVLFEAPVYDFVGLARAVEARTATPAQVDEALGRFWWTHELAPWRRSLFEATAARRLTLGGLDDQVSVTSRYARATLPDLVASALPEARAAECRQVVDRHLRWTYDATHAFDEAEKQRLQDCSRTAADGAATRASSDASDRAMLDSFARYAARQRADGTPGRDASMFRTLEWYLDGLPADSRVVVWTATVHAVTRSIVQMRRFASRGCRAAGVDKQIYLGSASAGQPGRLGCHGLKFENEPPTFCSQRS